MPIGKQATPLSSQATASMVQERTRGCQRLDDQREAAGGVIARTAVEPDPRASLTPNNAEAVVLNLMQPIGCRRVAYRFWLGGTAR